MQNEILEKNPSSKLQVYAIWLSTLPGDSRSRWDESLITDSRVIHLWDEDEAAGRWFSEYEGFYVPIAWDIYFLYGPDVHWEDEPSSLISSGHTIVSKRNQLQEDLLPLLQE